MTCPGCGAGVHRSRHAAILDLAVVPASAVVAGIVLPSGIAFRWRLATGLAMLLLGRVLVNALFPLVLANDAATEFDFHRATAQVLLPLMVVLLVLAIVTRYLT